VAKPGDSWHFKQMLPHQASEAGDAAYQCSELQGEGSTPPKPTGLIHLKYVDE
jgi:hypothetical protein